MTAKEKAEQILNIYNSLEDSIDGFGREHSKQCAIICIDEVLEMVHDSLISMKEYDYWKEVKQEIENYESDSSRIY